MIDSIRRQAHRVASSGDSRQANYNPFARVRSRESVDIENQNQSSITHTQSETYAPPAIEEKRHLESRETQKEFPAPAHADTSPVSPTSASSSGNAPGPSAEKDFAVQKDAKGSGEMSGNTIINGEPSGVTKRAKFKKIFGKEKDDEEKEAERVEAEKLSMEEKKRRAHKRKIPLGQQLRAVLFGSWINILLLFVPVGFAMYYAKVKPVPVFIINFVAIIPLAAMLSYATEELALRVGETFGGLLNATFGYVS